MSSTSNLRKRLDALIQNGKTIKCSAETTSAWRSLQMAKAWLGKALGYQGNATPYKAAYTAAEIPPTTDVATEAFPLSGDHLANVNAMRDAIQAEIESIDGLMPYESNQHHCYQKSLDHLVEAKMWYVFELAELREAVVLAPPTDTTPFGYVARKQVDLVWREDKSGVNVVESPDGKYRMGVDPYEDVKGSGGSIGVDMTPPAIIVESVPPPSKNLGNENKGSKKEQQGASSKKG